jgi:dCMP deaminase
MRPTWNDYFFQIAKIVASRSSCNRNKVGAIIVKDNNIISTGYNGAPKYQPNCQEIGNCYRNENNIVSGTNLEKCRAIGSHAETNAISLAAKHGHSTDNAEIYIVGHNFICAQCRAMIANSGIKIVYLQNTNNEIEKIFVNNWKIHSVDEKGND